MRHFVVVEGLIGVGKSTLCRLLHQAWGMKLVLEPAETNPFLESFYRDPHRYAFPVQMFYMLNRWRQQEQIRQQDLFEHGVVSDYLFAKDRLFAEKTLEPAELELYDRFAGALGERAPTPDLVVWVHAPLDVVMSRIAQRRAPGEELIERAYLEDLLARYEALLDRWTDSPILRIDNSALDYARRPADQRLVLDRIEAAITGRSPSEGATPAEGWAVQGELFGTGVY